MEQDLRTSRPETGFLNRFSIANTPTKTRNPVSLRVFCVSPKKLVVWVQFSGGDEVATMDEVGVATIAIALEP